MKSSGWIIIGSGLSIAIGYWYYKRRMATYTLGSELAAYFGAIKLRNQFYLVRHGQSEANVEGIIVSSPEIGTVKYTLTKRGESQAKRAGAKISSLCLEMGIAHEQLSDKLLIFCSDFLRTQATAKCIASEIGYDSKKIQTAVEIRERFFGELEGQADSHYGDVWAHDNYSAFHSKYGAESVSSVLMRAGKFVEHLNEKYQNKVIVLVAHGDVLQILSTGFGSRFPPAHHRKSEHLPTGSVTELINDASRA